MQEFTDTDLREALRRIQAAMPPLPEDFDARVLAAYDRRQRRRKVRRLIVWPSVVAAACAALLLVLNLGNGDSGQSYVAQKVSQPEQAKESVASTAVGMASRSEKMASNTQHLVNNYRKKEAAPSLGEEEPPTVAEGYESTDSVVLVAAPAVEPLMAANEEIAQPEEEIPIYNEADLPIINMENYAYTKEEVKKIEELHKQRLIAEIQSTVERARYRLEEFEKSFALD